MEEAVHRGPLRRLLRLRLDPEGWSGVVVGPLDRAPVHDARADPGAEEHRDPARQRELGLGVGPAEAHVAELSARVVEQDAERRDREPEVRPAERLRRPAEGRVERGLAFGREQYERNREAQDDDQRDPEDHLVNLGTLHVRSPLRIG